MRICISGPTQAGKTSLARLLQRIVPELEVISGDDYILEYNEDITGLRTALNAQTPYIFEHVSASSLMRSVDLLPSFALFLIPRSADPVTISKLAEEISIIADLGVPHAAASDIRDAMPLCLSFFRKSGYFPPVVSSFILKIASRCNLDCSYCYMYKGHDQSWREEPLYMSAAVATAAAKQISGYGQQHQNQSISVVLHGGEPLSLPVPHFRELVFTLSEHLSSLHSFSITIQTNGILITDAYLNCIDQLGLNIGVSLDGLNMTDNQFRITYSGDDSFAQSLRGLRRCIDFPFARGRFAGVLCVINPSSDGGSIYRYYRDIGISQMDFLLRDGTHDAIPGGPDASSSGSTRFLIAAFDAWFADVSPCSVPFFEAVIAGLLHEPRGVDSLGLGPMNALGISASGRWELLDVLRITFPGAWYTPYTVFDHEVSMVHESSHYGDLLRAQYDFADQCLGCNNMLVCGGGHLTHRYSSKNGFCNPSIHCATLLSFINHVRSRLKEAFRDSPILGQLLAASDMTPSTGKRRS